ncbi:hypothetical protein [Methylobacterium durans]|uniref:Uncharacterized protein n=1 Tax=Methylobacterium durans TaxID=2202825 RepID=A0A2U8W590_9HYPH|nr:hypothetical protein [Methylobacterium durans]AWN41275.1 hypothetical protein DK389_13070 [Methylobacterium durans]
MIPRHWTLLGLAQWLTGAVAALIGLGVIGLYASGLLPDMALALILGALFMAAIWFAADEDGLLAWLVRRYEVERDRPRRRD